jgi:uncharacterized membrane protein
MTMTYELFLTTFHRPETAEEASSWLYEWVRKGDVKVLDVVVLVKREDDSAVLRDLGDLASEHDDRFGAVLGGLLGAPGGPATAAALGALGAALGAAGELLTSRSLYHDDLKELQQALTPGTSALLAMVAPEHAAKYARLIADFGGETMRFSMSNDAGLEFQEAKLAFIARQVEHRRRQLAVWSRAHIEEMADLDAMNHQLVSIYAAMVGASEWQQEDLRVQAAAVRARRDAARALRNQSLAMEIQGLDEEIASCVEAASRGLSESERAALADRSETLHQSREAAVQQLRTGLDLGLQERRRDITALETLAAHADGVTRITLDLLLGELRDTYAAARKEREELLASVAMHAEPI